MNNLELMQMRLNYLGGDADGRLIKDKLKTFTQALYHSYQGVDITKDGVQVRVLINPDRLKQDYDDKIVSADFSLGLKPGDIFYWDETQTYWIIYLAQLSERAYFRGSIRKCEYQLQWLDELGTVKSVRAAIRGPVETKIVSDSKKGISYDVPNHTLNILIPNNEETEKVFKRYYKIMLNGTSWEVQAVDKISMPGIIEMTLQESYQNQDTDTEDLTNGKIVKNYSIQSTLDGVSEISIDTSFTLKTKVFFNYNEVQLTTEYQIVEGNAEIVDDIVIVHDTIPVKVRLSIPDISMVKDFTITGVPVAADITTLDIDGPLLVKPYGETIYQARKYVNGVAVVPTGTWELANNPYCSIVEQTPENLKLKWLIAKSGKIIIVYREDSNVVTKEIIIESLF